DFWKSLVLAHPPEPILGIAIIRLAAVHDAVNEGAISIFNVLRDYVRRLEVIVPEQKQGADERWLPGRKFCAVKQLVERPIQGRLRLDARARPRPQFGRFRRGEKFFELVHLL